MHAALGTSLPHQWELEPGLICRASLERGQSSSTYHQSRSLRISGGYSYTVQVVVVSLNYECWHFLLNLFFSFWARCHPSKREKDCETKNTWKDVSLFACVCGLARKATGMRQHVGAGWCLTLKPSDSDLCAHALLFRTPLTRFSLSLILFIFSPLLPSHTPPLLLSTSANHLQPNGTKAEVPW